MTVWLAIVVFTIIATLVVLYNRLVRSRNRVNTAWSDIDVQLQRRHDLIPNLVKAVEVYAKYERSTFQALTQLRSEAMKISSVDQLSKVEEKLSVGILRLLAVAEDYPDLKANENFLQLQSQLVEAEEFLQFARRYYNGSVRDYNTMIETVPSNFVASWFKFTTRSFFQKTSAEVAKVPLINIGSEK